ncbi:MAG: ribbon-helix-helix domain-containing protein [Deltaproteobacteria bacterium]|nr:ribbon-helix-helix domain-containing protein [Deltaproteobacteria bacterium]
MAKKPVQFRFDENLYKNINQVASESGCPVSDIVRNAISFYLAVYERTKDEKSRFYIGKKDDKNNLCEVILPR